MAIGKDIVDDEAVTDVMEGLYTIIAPKYFADLYMSAVGYGDASGGPMAVIHGAVINTCMDVLKGRNPSHNVTDIMNQSKKDAKSVKRFLRRQVK